MPKRMSTYDRRERAARLLKAAIPALQMSVRSVAEGPFTLRTRWPRGLGRKARAVWYWFDEDPHYPAGKTLLRVEKFLEEATWALRKRKVVRKSIEELLPKEKA